MWSVDVYPLARSLNTSVISQSICAHRTGWFTRIFWRKPREGLIWKHFCSHFCYNRSDIDYWQSYTFSKLFGSIDYWIEEWETPIGESVEKMAFELLISNHDAQIKRLRKGWEWKLIDKKLLEAWPQREIIITANKTVWRCDTAEVCKGLIENEKTRSAQSQIYCINYSFDK